MTADGPARERQQVLWERFKALACVLKHERGNETGYYIGINEEPNDSNVFLRIERCGDDKSAVALRVSPALEGQARLVFRVHVVKIINASVHTAPAGLFPVSYDPCRNQFTIETVPPVEEAEMAKFFLARAEILLNELQT